MNNLEKIGKTKTILISISILLVSVYSIFFYNSVFTDIETKKIIQQVTRFILTAILLLLVYNGKNWARIISIILFSIATLSAIVSVFIIDRDIILKIPLLVMIIVYSASIYHFSFSKSFKAFFLHQKEYQNN